MNRRHLLLSALTLAAIPLAAMPVAASADPLSVIPQVKKVGTGRLVVLMMPVFDATLYGPQGRWHPDLPFALKLDYLRDLQGDGMARRVVSEMHGIGFRDETRLTAWRGQMAAIFPDVHAGDSMTALRDGGGSTLFFRGNIQIGAIHDRGFTDQFFAICLGPQTSQPGLRKSLLGQA